MDDSLGIILHGICYDFFFVTGQIYVDKKAPRQIRGQAQGFLVLMTQGIGLGLGAQIMQRVVNANKQPSEVLLHTYNWEAIWQFCAVFAGVIMVLFLVLFHDDSQDRRRHRGRSRGCLCRERSRRSPRTARRAGGSLMRFFPRRSKNRRSERDDLLISKAGLSVLKQRNYSASGDFARYV